MKTINIDSNIDEFHNFFGQVQDSTETVIVWQLDPITQKRNIFHSKLSEVTNSDNSISFNTLNDSAYDFTSESLYFYVESRMSIFKAEQISIQNNFMSVRYPDELKFLDEIEDDKLKAVFSAINPNYVKVPPSFHEIAESKDKGYTFVSGEGRANQEAPDWHKVNGGGRNEKIETMWKGAINSHNSQSDHDKALFETELSFVTLDDEDKKYEGQRAAPRARPPEGKIVIISSKTNPDKPQETLPLFDLSRGGLGFMTISESAYAKGEVINILGFDNNKFDEPMFVIVRSVREADEMGKQFKVGCQFIDALQAEDEATKEVASS